MCDYRLELFWRRVISCFPFDFLQPLLGYRKIARQVYVFKLAVLRVAFCGKICSRQHVRMVQVLSTLVSYLEGVFLESHRHSLRSSGATASGFDNMDSNGLWSLDTLTWRPNVYWLNFSNENKKASISFAICA